MEKKTLIIIDTESGFRERFENKIDSENLKKEYDVVQIQPRTTLEIEQLVSDCISQVNLISKNKIVDGIFVDINVSENENDKDGIAIAKGLRSVFQNIPIFTITNKTKSDVEFDSLSEATLYDFDGVFVKKFLEGESFSARRLSLILSLASEKRKKYIEYSKVSSLKGIKKTMMMRRLSDEKELSKLTDDLSSFAKDLEKYELDDGNRTGLYTDFDQFVNFLNGAPKTNWLENLCDKVNHTYNNLDNFKNNYWGFTCDFFNTFFSSRKDHKYVIEKDQTKKNIHYDNSNKKWYLNIRLFRSFLQKYPIDISTINKTFKTNDADLIKSTQTNNLNQVKRLIRLFLLHEALHKVHNIDEHSVFGIGNFPRIVEEADYQADAFVIISEFFYWCQHDIGRLTKEQIINEFEEIIYVALNTTLSFSGTTEVENIQIRRFNRYTIWLYILAILNKLRTNRDIQDSGSTINKILDIFANKPILDIYGLNTVLVEDDSQFNKNSKGNPPKHTCFDLTNLDTARLDAAYLFENKVKRTGATTEKFNELIEGLRNSNLEKLKEFVSSLESII